MSGRRPGPYDDRGSLAPGPDGLPPGPEHQVLKSLLGAWALAACAPAEADAVEEHLGVCGPCADEALRLREAVGLLQRPETLDLNPALRTRVLEACLERRPPRVPVPEWAAAYDTETARLDALLQDFGDNEWHAPVRLRWYEGDEASSRRTTVAGVIAHLLTVDGLVAVALGLEDPLGDVKPEQPTPSGRTEAYWRAARFPPTRAVRGPWRGQSHRLIRTVCFTGSDTGRMPVPYGDFALPLHDAMLDRAFECWVHGEDIAEAVDYPLRPAVRTPPARHGGPRGPDAAPGPGEPPPPRAGRAGRTPPGRGRGAGAQPAAGDRGVRRRGVADPAGLAGGEGVRGARGCACRAGRGGVLQAGGGACAAS